MSEYFTAPKSLDKSVKAVSHLSNYATKTGFKNCKRC